MRSAQNPECAKPTCVWPHTLLAWWVAAAALAAAFAVGALVGSSSLDVLPHAGDVAASEASTVLYSDIRPPDVGAAVDDVAEDQ